MDIFDLSAILRLDSSEYESGISDAEEKFSGFGDVLQGAAKTGAVAIGALGAAFVGASAAMLSGVGSVAEYGDNIDKASQKMGISARAYQEWDAVLRHSGTDIKVVSRSMTTLAKAAEKGDKSFEALGITQEELASMNQEELFARTIEGLQNMEEGTERTALAQKLLGGSAKQLGALLNTSAEETQKMKDRVHELGGVMSDDSVKASAAYQDSLQDMQTAMDGVKRNIQAEFLPSMTTIMDGLTNIFAGYTDEGMPLLEQGVSDLIDKLIEMIPRVTETAGSLLTALINAIIENLPKIISGGARIVGALIRGIIKVVPEIVKTTATMLGDLITTIKSKLPEFLEKGKDLLRQISSGIATLAPIVATYIATKVGEFVTAIGDKLPEFLEKGKDFLRNISSGIAELAPVVIEFIVAKIGEFITAIGEKMPEFIEKGKDFLRNVATGIAELAPIVVAFIIAKAGEFVQAIGDKLPDFLEKGKEILRNVASGLVETIPVALAAIAVMLAQVVARIIEALPDFLAKGADIIKNIASGIINNVKTFVTEKIPAKLAEIANAFLEYDWLGLGKNIIGGIIDGVVDAASGLIDAVGGAIGDALGFAKGLLNINSPSRVFRDQVGKPISEGVAVGIEDASPLVTDAIGDLNDDALDAIDGIGYDADVSIRKVGNGKEADSGSKVAEALERMNSTLEWIDQTISDRIAEAIGDISLELNGREFGRLVNNVRTN